MRLLLNVANAIVAVFGLAVSLVIIVPLPVSQRVAGLLVAVAASGALGFVHGYYVGKNGDLR